LKIGRGQIEEIKIENLNGNIVFMNGNSDMTLYPLTKCNKSTNNKISCENVKADIGYYLNAMDDTKKTLIKCDSETHCVIETPPTGYYLNKNYNQNNNKIIKCSGTCEIIAENINYISSFS